MIGRPSSATELEIEGRRIRFTNVDKVLWPRLGLTKAWLVDYYTQIAPVLLSHLRRHPLTLRRFPDGVEGANWFETRAPAHPEWIETMTFHMRRTGKVFDVCVVDDLPSLVWAAQIAAIELHPFLGTADALDTPQAVVFDLDPGAPATLIDSCRVGLWLREILDGLGLQAWPKTSGRLGLHVHVPLNTPVTYDETKAFARAVALVLEQEHPHEVVSMMAKAKRVGKVFVDWGQNDPGKSTVAAYSLRGFEIPTVSTPVDWDEVEQTVATENPSGLRFLPQDVLERSARGDPFAPVTSVRQRLPADIAGWGR